MSERGSFVTEWMYCDECRKAVWSAFSGMRDVVAIQGGAIVAGKIGELFAGGEAFRMREIVKEIETCHPVRIAVIPEDAERATVFCDDALCAPMFHTQETQT